MRKRWTLVQPPRFRLRFYQNVFMLFVAIPPRNAEAADLGYRFRYRFPSSKALKMESRVEPPEIRRKDPHSAMEPQGIEKNLTTKVTTMRGKM